MHTLAEKKLLLQDSDLKDEFQQFTKKINIYSAPERKKILSALSWARVLHGEQRRDSGELYVIHPLQVASNLIDIKIDSSSVIAALLHDVLEDTDVQHREVVERFGETVGALVEGVTKISGMKVGLNYKSASLRKMIWAMVDDIRVIFIKLADKQHNMNTLEHIQVPERRKRIASECLDIFAPMAGKLGMSNLRSELEDLSLKYLDPETYSMIREHVSLKRDERAEYLMDIQKEILSSAKKANIDVAVHTRAKHFYSIYNKMKNRGKALDEIYDLLGMRVICKNHYSCYTALGLVHELWVPMEGRFKDFIANPKSNGYQSLHTSVLTTGAKPLEIQIRSHMMHETAEYGLAAHWAYKEGKNLNQMHPDKITVIKQIKTLKAENIEDENDFLETIKREVLQDSIIVYTPKGDPIELPEGSTAIDMAYHIHSEIGDHCMGAKADNVILPLTRPLKSTQTIQILTSVNSHPHINWLKHVRSTRTRTKIINWLNHHDSDVLIHGNIVARTYRKPEKISDKTKAINKRKNTQQPTRKQAKNQSAQQNQPAVFMPETKRMDHVKVGININGQNNVTIKKSRCCSPVPGERIIGYISRGCDIIIHKAECKNLKGIPEFNKRRIDVDWETNSSLVTKSMRIHSHYTHDLFSEIEGAIRKHRGHLISGSLNETERGDLEGFFTVEMQRKEDFKKISRSIRAIPTVLFIASADDLKNYHSQI